MQTLAQLVFDHRERLLEAGCQERDVDALLAALAGSDGGRDVLEVNSVKRGELSEAVLALLERVDYRPSSAELRVLLAFFRQSQAASERADLVGAADSSRRMLEAVIESIPFAVGIAEAPSGKIVHANRWVERILRHRPPETTDLAGYTQWLCIHPDGRPFEPHEYPLARAVSHGETVHAQPIDYLFGDGTKGTIEVSAAPVLDAQGVVTAAVVVYGDITERRRQEALAQRGSEFEQQLIGIVSHDLRGPLSAIAMTAEVGLRDPGDRQRHFERIRKSVDRASRMVRDLLDFTQARLGGGVAVAPRRGSLSAIVQQQVDEVRAARPDRQIDLVLDAELEGFFDPDRLAQALDNGLANALAHGKQGAAVKVTVSQTAGDFLLEVWNDGPAIPPQLLSEIFQPLCQGGTRPTDGRRSIGLGLYIVDQIMRAHGGGVDVRTGAAEGTAFTLRLPRGASAEAPRI